MDKSKDIISLVQAGMMLDYGGSIAPTGYLVCDGSAVSRVTYSRLFNIIGTTYGSGDGSTTFNLPDCRGRTSIGAGQGAGLTNRIVGQSGGEESHQLIQAEMATHTHVQNSHNHGIRSALNGGSAYGPDRITFTEVPSAIETTESITAVNQSTGGNQAHNNMQPSLVANKIIKF